MHLDTLKELITQNLDVYDLLDILGISMAELTEILEDQIREHFDELVGAVE